MIYPETYQITPTRQRWQLLDRRGNRDDCRGFSPAAIVRRMFGKRSARLIGDIVDGSINTVVDSTGNVLGEVVCYHG